MEKQRKWQLFLILAVIALTIYNILPTFFYYLKPLSSPITEKYADKVSTAIEKRVLQLDVDSKDWIQSFCNQLRIKPVSIQSEEGFFRVRFSKTEDANRFRQFLPRAGSLIPFVPAQLGLGAQEEENLKEVVVKRRLPIKLKKEFFAFAEKGSPLYREWMIDRAAHIANILAGPSEQAMTLSLGMQNPRLIESLALQINAIAELSKTQKAVANRLAASFTQGPFPNKAETVRSLIKAFDTIRDEIKKRPELEKKEMTFLNAEHFLKEHQALFVSGSDPLSLSEAKKALTESNSLSIGSRNSLFSDLEIDWDHHQIFLKLHPDVNPSALEQQLINEIAKVAHHTNETLAPHEKGYAVDLHKLENASSFLILDLYRLGKVQAESILDILKSKWNPQHPDLVALSIVKEDEWGRLAVDQKALSLVIHAPNEENPALIISANGLEHIQKNYELCPDSDLAQTFNSDLKSLMILLQQNGFSPRKNIRGELFFENEDYYLSLIAATREDFQIRGKYAALEFLNIEHRLLCENQIDTKIHEDLIKCSDEYHAAQVSLHSGAQFDFPKPTKNILLNNFLLSMKKLFRGDERKVIRWGLDLSGGKTVQIELRDANGQLVKNEEEIKQGINELYNRVNKMGVSEVCIRGLGNHIVLDFPGSQSFSAAELIKASSMYFHVVNEKFSSLSSPLSATAQRFLQEVWNEAVVTNRKDAASINKIAWKHLHADSVSETARTLIENGLVLQSPDDPSSSSDLNDTLCKIATLRSDNWMRQTHPLLIVYNNYALEGSQLSSVNASYDPQKGNYLSFEVKSSSFDRNGQKKNPRAFLQAWTSKYSKEKVLGTTLEEFTNGNGWRMAVILNDSVISAPTLDAVIRDSGSISGHFSQREVSQLVSDLKAGSLSFTPHILSEKNVSPELGHKDRSLGIMATIFALVLVIASMIIYYRFAGLIASIAVLFNLLMLWGCLQNIGAALSLAGIAGIILTVGMAVDANVLVFERFKEEFAESNHLPSAMAAAYKKAYSAIVDSNVTTIIAALILLNFDAGPIKGFATTLIIGIVSSMFSALFMTRYYFSRWVRKNKILTMANWVRAKSINFLKHAKFAFLLAIATIAIGSSLVYLQRSSILGMDFTGGFSLHIEVDPKTAPNPISNVEEALLASNASNQDFQLRELSPSNHLRILFAANMEQPGKPFYTESGSKIGRWQGDTPDLSQAEPATKQLNLKSLAMQSDSKTDGCSTTPEPVFESRAVYNLPIESDTHTNPRIDWMVKALQSQQIELTPNCLKNLESSWTRVSGQMSDSMRNNALIGLLIAFVCIFIYIAFRFEYKFAAAAILCVIHDVLITIAVIGILFAFGVCLQIDLNTVAAIMTIVGYSLNDTIIIFDRIREEMRLSPKAPLSSIVNQALNSTLSRTTITSGTTLLVLLALVIFGGSSIFSFALVMTIGVFLGTLSSWYIAAPLMLMFHTKEEKRALSN